MHTHTHTCTHTNTHTFTIVSHTHTYTHTHHSLGILHKDVNIGVSIFMTLVLTEIVYMQCEKCPYYSISTRVVWLELLSHA